MNLQPILNFSVTLDLAKSLNYLFFLFFGSAEDSVPVVETNPAAGIEVMQFNKIQMFFFFSTFLWLIVFSQKKLCLSNDRVLNTRLFLSRASNLKLNNQQRGFLGRNQRPPCQNSMTSLFLELCVSWPKLFCVVHK